MRAALAPKVDDKGERKKWAAVCCDAAQGHKPGDPVFTAWVRLAATPVREVKAAIGEPADERRGRRGGGRPGGRPGGPGRPQERSDGDRKDGPGRGRDDRPRKGGRPSGAEMAQHAKDGTLTTGIRIAADREEDKREREKRRKEERDRKRQAERERLSRFGY